MVIDVEYSLVDDTTSLKEKTNHTTTPDNKEMVVSKPILNRKTQLRNELLAMGKSLSEVLEITDKGKKLTPEAKRQIKLKFEKWSLTTPKMVKLANEAVTDTLQLKEINGVTPTASNRLVAAQMVYDRAEPVIKQTENLHAVLFHPVDLSQYS
jgi:hypothetical protein